MELTRISTLQDFDFVSFGMRRGMIDLDGIPFAFHFDCREGARALIVTFSNLVGRSFEPPPSFDPLAWSIRRDFNLLSISDPTLLMDDRIEVGAFLGTAERDPIPGVCTIINDASNQIGFEHTLLWGASGGGVGAVKAAARTGFPVVAINTQICLSRLRHWAVVQDVARAFGNFSPTELCERYPDRVSIEADLQQRTSRHVFWVQNTEDEHHYSRHYATVCSLFDVPVQGGTTPDKRFTAMQYSSPEGHGPVPDWLRNKVLDYALGCILAEARNADDSSIATARRSAETTASRARCALPRQISTPTC